MDREPFCIYQDASGNLRFDTAAYGPSASDCNYKYLKVKQDPMAYARVMEVTKSLNKGLDAFKNEHSLVCENAPVEEQEVFFFVENPLGNVEPGTASKHADGAKFYLCDVTFDQLESAWAEKVAAGYSLKKVTIKHATTLTVQDA